MSSLRDKRPALIRAVRPSRDLFAGRRPGRFFGRPFGRSTNRNIGRGRLRQLLGSPRAFFVVAIGLVALAAWSAFPAGGDEGSAPVYVPVSSREAGRSLTSAEAALAARFGTPVAMGDGGFPVVVHHVTGEAREITPFEAAWKEVGPFRSAGIRDVVEAPGPRGWGLRWRDDSHLRQQSTYLALPRHAWRERQEAELTYAVDLLMEATALSLAWDVGYPSLGLGQAVRDELAAFRARHPVLGNTSSWAAVPGQWRCDVALESSLNQGLTVGCPSAPYLVLLRESWVSVGILAARLDALGGLLDRMEGMATAELVASGLVAQVEYQALDLAVDAERLDLATRLLWERSAAEELPIYAPVELPR